MANTEPFICTDLEEGGLQKNVLFLARPRAPIKLIFCSKKHFYLFLPSVEQVDDKKN